LFEKASFGAKFQTIYENLGMDFILGLPVGDALQ